MTGFRSGTSGSLIQRAKAAGGAIGKKGAVGGLPSKSSPAGSLSFPFQPVPCSASPLLSRQSSPEKPAPFMAPCRPGLEAGPDPPSLPPAPGAQPDPMWDEYRTFKAAGLLAEWRRRWACYLVRPAA